MTTTIRPAHPPRTAPAITTVTRDPVGVGGEVHVKCDHCGFIAGRFAVPTTAVDSAIRHTRTYHRNTRSTIVLAMDPEVLDRAIQPGGRR